MLYMKSGHLNKLLEALNRTNAIKENGRIDSYYGASLYLLTGLEYAWPRLKKHVHPGYIDFEPMLNSGLSSGEAIIVRLAGNFYNGGFWNGMTPFDVMNTLDAGMFDMAMTATMLRKRKLTVDDFLNSFEHELKKEA